MPGGLTGSAPKASFSTQSTTSPVQQDLLSQLAALLGGGQIQPAQGTFSAPLSPLQQTSLAALEQSALSPTFGESFTGNQVTAPQIDSTAAFQKGVVEPVTSDFLNKTLPATAGKYGAGAGGAFSSDAMMARQMASENTSRALAQAGSQFAYDAAKANQGAQLQADLSNQALRERQPMNYLNALIGLLGAGGVEQQQGQQQIAGSYAAGTDFLRLLLGAATQPTQQTTGVGTGGSSGILPGLIQAGGTLGAAYLLSDERIKEDIIQVGDVEGIPLYAFRYKGQPATHLGFMAQDVEQFAPEAVVEIGGVKHVNYAKALEAAFA